MMTLDTNTLYNKDLITLNDWNIDEIESVIELSQKMKSKNNNGKYSELLQNKTVYSLFYNTSTRTRASFQSATAQMGGITYSQDPQLQMQISIGEQIKDTAQVLSRYNDALAVRYCFIKNGYGEGNSVIRSYAKYSKVPVINLECDTWHPCQTLADLMVMREKLGNLKNKKLVMSWAYGKYVRPTAVPQDVITLFSRLGMDIVLAHPPEFKIDEKAIDLAKEHTDKSGGTFKITDDMEEAFEGADAVYPKNWGIIPLFTQMDKIHEISKKYTNWKTTTELMDKTNQGKGIYLHCLPAERGIEVEDEVMDGPNSVVLDEAENRLHTAKGLLAHLLTKEIN